MPCGLEVGSAEADIGKKPSVLLAMSISSEISLGDLGAIGVMF